ncbi:MAG: hypothetical protein JSR80_01275 [Verrucomicrobia bacterium]|nr:hypothetical protein [Verrucomicrobiota bacterium]
MIKKKLKKFISVNKRIRTVFLNHFNSSLKPPIAHYFPCYVLSKYGQNRTNKEAFEAFCKAEDDMPPQQRFNLFFELMNNNTSNLLTPWEQAPYSPYTPSAQLIPRLPEQMSNVGGCPVWAGLYQPAQNQIKLGIRMPPKEREKIRAVASAIQWL